MALEIKGIIKKFIPAQTGAKKDGSGNWVKQNFLVETESQYNNLYCFEVFGDEKVQNLSKYQKVGDVVTVEFNVNTNEHNGNYYTTLSAWKISKNKEANEIEVHQPTFEPATNFKEEEHDDLPF
jgi:hypothetical protein